MVVSCAETVAVEHEDVRNFLIMVFCSSRKLSALKMQALSKLYSFV